MTIAEITERAIEAVEAIRAEERERVLAEGLDLGRLTAAIKTVVYGGRETLGGAFSDAIEVAAEYARLGGHIQ